MAEKDAKLLACLRACREGVFGEALKDCDVPMDCVVAEGYRLGDHVHTRRQTFGRGADDDADERLRKAGFVPISGRSTAARVDDALRRHGPVLRAAAKRGLGSQANTKLLAAVKWLGGRIARMKARASDAADNVYLDLAVELGDAAPEGAKGGKHGTEVYWARRLAVQARAVLEGEDAARPKKKAAAPKKRASSPPRLPPKKRAKSTKKRSGRRR